MNDLLTVFQAIRNVSLLGLVAVIAVLWSRTTGRPR